MLKTKTKKLNSILKNNLFNVEVYNVVIKMTSVIWFVQTMRTIKKFTEMPVHLMKLLSNLVLKCFSQTQSGIRFLKWSSTAAVFHTFKLKETKMNIN